jgi:hypothetical protein
MGVYGGNRTMSTEIMNCTFSNCLSRAVYGEAQGLAPFGGIATISPIIKNCIFNNTSNGCVIRIFGSTFTGAVRGYAAPKIIGNIFADLRGTAFYMNVGSYPGGSTADFINNTVVNCRAGVDSREPWDAKAQNNIFVLTTNAVMTSGALSRAISYNCFSNNATNFTGYPSTYGQVILQNRNGTPCDLLFNIFQNPLFVGADDFHLADNSPCIDAGDITNPNFGDMCFDVSRGTAISDLGAYGGPDACNWLDVVPLVATSPWMTLANGDPAINWDAIPRSTYRIQYITNAVDTQWENLANVIATQKRTSRSVTLTNGEGYFRIESLGRAPGN